MQSKNYKKNRAFKGLSLCSIILVLWGFNAAAQVAAPTKNEAAQKEPAQAKQEQAAPDQQVAENDQQPADFDLLELRVKGNTLLDENELGRTVYPFLGLKKTIDTVESARAALEKMYQGKGYQTVAVDIPEQDVKNGIVYLQVVEGKVSRLRVVESRYFSLGKIKAGVPELAEGHVPNFPQMQKELAALGGQSEDRKIQPVLRAGETPGTLEVDLKVKDKLPFHGKLELNGRNTSSTSRLRLVTSLHYDNLWQAMHSASVMYQVSPEDNQEVDVWAGTYVMPVFNTDAKLAFYTVSSSSNAQIASAGALNVIGIGNVYGLRLVKPLGGLDKYFHSATLGVDYKDFKEDLNLIGADKITTPISYLPFLAQYSGSLRGEESLASFDLGLHFSIRGLGNDQKEFENKRFLAKSNFMYLTGNARLQHDLPKGMELVSRFSGQVADSPLISNEQFSMGGDESVRGYFETQTLADDGVFGSLELHSPHLGKADWDFVNNLKVLAFVDAAKGWIQKPLPGNSSGHFISGGGLGMRFQLWNYLNGMLDIGFPFTSLAPVKGGDPRVHFKIFTEF